MTLYGIYDIPNWARGALTNLAFGGTSLPGLFDTTPVVRARLKASPVHNDVVSWVFAGG